MSLKKNVEKQVRSENESKENFFAWRSSERFLFTLSFPFPVEPTSTSFKNTVIKKGKKFLARVRRVILTWEILMERGRVKK